MTDLPAEVKIGDSGFETNETQLESSAVIFQDTLEPPNTAPDVIVAEVPISIAQSVPPARQPLYQTLLPGAGLGASGSKNGDRCAVCVYNYCERRHECPGKGGRKNCRCPHPPLASSVKPRIPEAKILAFIAARRSGQ
jgi:hypothetical protein